VNDIQSIVFLNIIVYVGVNRSSSA